MAASLWDQIVSSYWRLNEPKLMHRNAEGEAARRAARTEWFDRTFAATTNDPERKTPARSEFIKAYVHRKDRWAVFASRFRNSDDFQAAIHGFLNVGQGASWTLFLYGPVLWCWYLMRWFAGLDSLRILARAARNGQCGDCGYQVEQQSDDRWSDLCAARQCPGCGNLWPCLPPDVPD